MSAREVASESRSVLGEILASWEKLRIVYTIALFAVVAIGIRHTKWRDLVGDLFIYGALGNGIFCLGPAAERCGYVLLGRWRGWVRSVLAVSLLALFIVWSAWMGHA